MPILRLWLATVLINLIPAFAASPVFAASVVETFKNRVNAQGGCINIHIFSDAIPNFPKMPERLNDASLYGKPLIDWSDNEIAETIQFYRDCDAKNHAAAVDFCIANRTAASRIGNSGVPRSSSTASHRGYCENIIPWSAQKDSERRFEDNIKSKVMSARNLDNQKRAQQAAQVEIEKAEAQRRREQAEKDSSTEARAIA
jgi:hypothetical protein